MRFSSGSKISIKSVWKLLPGIAVFLWTGSLQAQNLVPDPGFEKLDYCPNKGFKNQATLKALSMWWCPNKTSPDCINTCAKGSMDHPQNNVGGSQDPYEGEGYAGICHGRKVKYFESLQTRLTQPLEAGKLYVVTLHVSFGDKVFYATNEIGVALTKEKISSKGKEAVRPDVYLPVRIGYYYTDKEKWMTLRTMYLASGGEEYLTLGFMNPYPDLQLVGGKLPKAIDGEADDVYYFVDDVSVEEYEFKPGSGGFFKYENLTLKPPPLNKLEWFQLAEIGYDPGEHVPLPGSLSDADRIAVQMLKDTAAILLIRYKASEESLKPLLEIFRKRLNFLRMYLICKGVHPDRIDLDPVLYTDPMDKTYKDTVEFQWK